MTPVKMPDPVTQKTELRIVGDGTRRGTRVETSEGVMIGNIHEVTWSLNIEHDELAEVSIRLRRTPVNVTGKLGPRP